MTEHAVTVERVTTAQQMAAALAVRRAVFIIEQAVPESVEIDEHDGDPAEMTSALHVIARCDGEVVGTARLLLPEISEGVAHIGRVAVLRSHRGRGIGYALMRALHDLAHEHGITTIALNAQLHALAFYEKLGYQAHGDVFLDANIPHRAMTVRHVLNPEDMD